MVHKRTKSDYVIDTITILLLIIVFLITFFPFWNIFITSLNDAVDTMKGGLLFWPRVITFKSYKAIFSNEQFMRAGFVSFLRVVIGTPITVLCTAMLAFVFTKKDLIGYKVLRKLFAFTMYFSGGMIPTYMVYKSYGLLDNFLVYILPLTIGVYYMLLMNSFMSQLPKELEESATVDGANEIVIFFKIIIPLSLPILATIVLFVAINHWNAFFDSYLYMVNKTELKTLQVVMMNILNQYQTSGLTDPSAAAAAAARGEQAASPDSIRMTATMVSTIPIILVYPFIQKYFVKGMMIGAIKA